MAFLNKNNQIKRRKMLRHHHIPILLVPSEKELTWNHDAVDNRLLELKYLSLLYGKFFSGFSQELLVVENEDYTITLHRPYFKFKGDFSDTNTSIQFPCLFSLDDFDPELLKDLNLGPEEEPDPEFDP